MTDTPALVPLTQAARELGVSKSTLYTMAKSGQLDRMGLPVFSFAGKKVTRAQLDLIKAQGFNKEEAVSA